MFVSRRIWPAAGGIESFGRDLAAELAARHDVRVVAQRVDEGTIRPVLDGFRGWPRFETGSLPDTDVRVEQLRISIPRRLALLGAAWQYAPVLQRDPRGRVQEFAGFLYGRLVGPEVAKRARHADVVHVLGGNEVAIAGVRAARLLAVPAVVTPFAHPGQWDDDAASAAAYRQADAVVATLDADADACRALGVPPQRLHVQGLCSRGVAMPRDRRLRQDLDGPLVVFLGIRRPHKGADLLLEAAAVVARERPDVTFAVVGPGPPLRVPNGAKVLDVGRVDEAEKARWLWAADLLCLPSAAESFGLAVLEAWSTRTPALVSDIPALRELVGRGGGGAFVERTPDAFARAILTLLADPGELRRLGEAGWRRWASHHSPQVCARWHEELYEGLVSDPKQAPARGGADSA